MNDRSYYRDDWADTVVETMCPNVDLKNDYHIMSRGKIRFQKNEILTTCCSEE